MHKKYLYEYYLNIMIFLYYHALLKTISNQFGDNVILAPIESTDNYYKIDHNKNCIVFNLNRLSNDYRTADNVEKNISPEIKNQVINRTEQVVLETQLN